MNCCGAPSTSSSAARSVAERPNTAHGVAETTLQGLLFSQILKPLAKDLGPVGEVALESVVQRMFGPAGS